MKKNRIKRAFTMLLVLSLLAVSGSKVSADENAKKIVAMTQTLPIIWAKEREFHKTEEGFLPTSFWKKNDKKTSVFAVNRLNRKGNVYSIAASNKMGAISARHQDNKLVITIENAKVSLKKSQLSYPKDKAISEIMVRELQGGDSSAVQFEFVLRENAKDFALQLDELGERLLVEVITNAITQVRLDKTGDEERLTIESYLPVTPELSRGEDNCLEITLPSSQSLIKAQQALPESRFITKMAITGEDKDKTKIKLWLKEGTEFAPENQSIRFYEAKTKDIHYHYGVLRIRKPKDFQMEKVDYIQDIYAGKASLSFPHLGYINGTYWIGDNYITKVEEKDGRLEFTFPSLHELTIAEDRDSIYISARKPKQVFQHVVFIDIGHGGNDPGAVKIADIGFGSQKYYEKDANFQVAMLLKAKLEQAPHIKAYFSRLSDVNPSASERVKLANESGADIFLSLHNNMTTVKDRKIEGTDVYYLKERRNETITAKALAETILAKYRLHTNFTNRLISNAPHLYMVKYPQMPAVIVESGFMSDEDDLRKIFHPEEQEKTAEALYQSILEIFQ